MQEQLGFNWSINNPLNANMEKSYKNINIKRNNWIDFQTEPNCKYEFYPRVKKVTQLDGFHEESMYNF